jgi:hypothetical protein
MTQEIESFYRQIGIAAIEQAGSSDGRILIYSEAEDGAVSADLFYRNRSENEVHFKLCTSHLCRLIYDFWERWQEVPGNLEWRVMCFLVEGTKFTVDLAYPDGINTAIGSDGRPAAVAKYFDGATVDLSAQH